MIRPLLLLALAGCAGTPPPRVSLADGWPDAAPGWKDARDRWTRRDGRTEDFVRLVHAAATLQSPEWRAAYARERARLLRLPPEEEGRLVAAQQAAAAEAWEVELVVTTAKPEWNDLRKGTASMWRLALASADGREVTPLSVTEDRRPRGELEAYFPDLQPFYQAFVVKFPKKTPDGQPIAAGKLTLKVASPVAALEMVWSE